MSGATNRAVFLDRDGVVVIPEFRDGRSYAPRRLKDFVLYPDAAFELERLRRAGFVLVVVTNQPDVGNGLTERSVVESMHETLLSQLPVSAVKVCFHSQRDGCRCRKPEPGMLLEAADEFGIDLSQSFMVGDRASDVAAGHRVGCETVFIDLGYDEAPPSAPFHRVLSLKEAVDRILATQNTETGK